MNSIRCPRCGAPRPEKMKEACSTCGGKSYWFNLYLYPGEALGLKVAVGILVITILLVTAGLVVMHQIYKIDVLSQTWLAIML